ncbi:enoyl-CoA delta isomerase 1, mitochondrial-like isoform X2 [Panthera uncia]|uniref:enoyl-CoA delta isomerase 1, mitochondrial-like isoform X2 n=1 Tax=Panthera uncia TaxID=29064 RepID=UPI0020FF9F91|nr:enoyl-CoA delta isomerase 1, mitochondrial-like isoform X2 [Panthera uncia]
MALMVGARVLARNLLRPWSRLPDAVPGRTGPAAGGGDGVRCFGSPRVLVETDPSKGVAVIKLKNPPVNSLSLEVLTEFVISLEKLENDKTFRGVILTSHLPACAGVCSVLDLEGKSERVPPPGLLSSPAQDHTRSRAQNPLFMFLGEHPTLPACFAFSHLKLQSRRS